jgi:hypothetical protein
MSRSVTFCTEANEVLVGVVTQFAARREMVDLKTICGSAVLAAPSVALEHLAAQASIGFRLKP